MTPIKNIKAGEDQVWAQNPLTGEMGYGIVERQITSDYKVTVRADVRDSETGAVQTIVSNTIHPYFVQLPEGATAPPSSERHVYDGRIARGAWVDASNLKAGYRLLNDDGSWAEVTGITVEQAPLKAYNLTIEGYHTFFVSGNAEANPVWVHNNNCIQFSAQANAAARRLGINASDITVNNGVANISIIQTRNLRFSDFDTLRSDLRANGASSVNINTGVVINHRINDLLSTAAQQGTSFRGLNVFRTGPNTFILTGRI